MRDFICPTAEQHLALEDVVCTKFVGALVFSREKIALLRGYGDRYRPLRATSFEDFGSTGRHGGASVSAEASDTG
jgi:hypothetical protein